MTSFISTACTGNSGHMMCRLNHETCACSYCHLLCERCGNETRMLYCRPDELPDDTPSICAPCYKEISALDPKMRWPLCMGCHEHKKVVYREPRSDDKRHLCITCHKAAGHRYWERGTWLQDVQVATPAL